MGEGGISLTMRYVEAEGAKVSVIGLGTWQFGSIEWGYGSDYASREAPSIVKRALEVGINLIDTAEIYGFGRSERIVGRALGDRRDEAFIATKVFPVMPLGPVVEMRGRASASRLGTDRIDLYQVHWPNPIVPVSATMSGMRKLLDSGVIRHVGVSNFSLGGWQKAEASLGHPVLSNQVQFSLASRRAAGDLVPYAERQGRILIAYSPLAQGFLGAKYDARNLPRGLMRRMNPLFYPENLERAGELFAALREIAAAHDATASQVALAWVIAHPGTVAIPGAGSLSQVESNAEAADLQLSADELARLTEEAEGFRPVSGPAAIPGLVGLRNKGGANTEPDGEG